jgi:hypothetical protein
VTAAPPATVEGGVHTVRRVVFYLLLFTMVVIAAIGLSGLLGRLLDAGNQLLADDTSSLAQSLAFTLIAGPLAAVLWWLVWRGLQANSDRASVAWPLYLMLASLTALVTSVLSLLAAATAGIHGRWPASELAVGIVWAGVWLWHHWMLRHPTLGPVRMRGVTPTLGALFGLIVATISAVTAIGGLLDALVETTSSSLIASGAQWQAITPPFVSTLVGTIVWWWYWYRQDVKSLGTGFARVVLVLVAGGVATAVAVFGIVTTLHVVLRVLLDPSEPLAARLDPLGTAVAAALVGTLLWRYHRDVVAGHPPVVGESTRLLTAGVTLATVATGVGVVVNSLLAAFSTTLAGTGIQSLLLGGLSALVIGGPLWWVTWLPRAQREPQMMTRPGRRSYLVAVFGVSALVALITLILIAFRLFELGLGNSGGEGILEGIRSPLGLLTATLLVAGYHFAIWRRERPAASTAPVTRRVGRVILVTGADATEAQAWVESTLGARVEVWSRADAIAGPIDRERLAAALDGVSAPRVLVVASDDRLDVIPLAG